MMDIFEIAYKILGRIEEKTTAVDNVFDKLANSRETKEAEEAMKPYESTQEGQKKIIELASKGEPNAVLYLFKRFLPLFKKAYWKYYVGPERGKNLLKYDVENVEDLAIIALSLLSGQNDPNPYLTFSVDGYDDEVDLLKPLSHYMFRYFQNECVKKYTAENKKGLEGNVKKDDVITASSLDDTDDKQTVAPVESHENLSTLRVMLEGFRSWLKNNKDDNYLTVWDMKADGYPTSDIKDALGLSEDRMVRSMWNDIKKWFIEKYPEAVELLK